MEYRGARSCLWTSSPASSPTFSGFFFNTLQYVLPCKYCRQSLKIFYEELPIEPYLKNKKKLSYWLYLIHNKVNKKLRDQGLNDNKNPTFKEVVKKYDEINKTNSNKDICELSYWDFLYCYCFYFLVFWSGTWRSKVSLLLISFLWSTI